MSTMDTDQEILLTRICTKCGEEKTLSPEFFYKRPACQWGLTPQCIECTLLDQHRIRATPEGRAKHNKAARLGMRKLVVTSKRRIQKDAAQCKFQSDTSHCLFCLEPRFLGSCFCTKHKDEADEKNAWRRYIEKVGHDASSPTERVKVRGLFGERNRIKARFGLHLEVDHFPKATWKNARLIHRIANLRLISAKDNDHSHCGLPCFEVTERLLEAESGLLAHLLTLQKAKLPTYTLRGSRWSPTRTQ